MHTGNNVFGSRTPTHLANTASTSRQVNFDSRSSPATASARKHGRADATTRRPVRPLRLRLCPRLQKVEVARCPQTSRRCTHRQFAAGDRDPESGERHLCLFPRSAHRPRVAAAPSSDRVRLGLDSHEPTVRPELRDGPRPPRPVGRPRRLGAAGRPNPRRLCVLDRDQLAELGERSFGVVASSLHGPGNPATRFIAPAGQLDIDAPDAVTNQLQPTDTSARRSLIGLRHFAYATRFRRGLLFPLIAPARSGMDED